MTTSSERPLTMANRAHQTRFGRSGAGLRLMVACTTLSIVGAASPGAPPPKPETPAGARAPDRQGRVDLRPRFRAGQETRLKLELKDAETPRASAGKPSRTGTAKPRPDTSKPQPADPLDPDATGTSIPSSSQQEIGILLRVKETGPDGTKLDIVYESLKISLHGPLGEIEFDSKSKAGGDADPAAEIFRSIVGTTLIADLDPDGRVRSVTGEPRPGAGGDLSANLAGDFLKGSFGSIMTAGDAPARANVGDQWTTRSVMTAPGGSWTINATNTLKSASGGRAMIDIRGTVTLDSATSGAGLGAAIPESKYTGRVAWDTEAGMIENMETTMRITVRPPTSAGGGETVREVTTRITRLR